MEDTGSLLNRLNKAKKTKELESHLSDLDNVATRGFGAYFNQYIQEHGMNITDVIRDAFMDRSYCYQIIRGEKNPGRDKIITMSLAARMDLVHTQRGLEIAKAGILYSRSRRDSVLIYAINNKMSVVSTNALLEQYGETPLA